MTILQTRTRADPRARPVGSAPEDRLNRRGSLEPREPGRPRRSLVVALLLACLTLVTLDHVNDGGSAASSASAWASARAAPSARDCLIS